MRMRCVRVQVQCHTRGRRRCRVGVQLTDARAAAECSGGAGKSRPKDGARYGIGQHGTCTGAEAVHPQGPAGRQGGPGDGCDQAWRGPAVLPLLQRA
jgi:hypothetical protein